MWKLGTRPHSFIYGNICLEFLVQCSLGLAWRLVICTGKEKCGTVIIGCGRNIRQCPRPACKIRVRLKKTFPFAFLPVFRIETLDTYPDPRILPAGLRIRIPIFTCLQDASKKYVVFSLSFFAFYLP
jgi:hypothetical protein